MIPLYFPFTTVSPAAGERLSACFEKIAVYQTLDCPLQNKDAVKTDNNFLKFLHPLGGDGKKIAAVIKDYKNWIHLHEDAPLAFLRARNNGVPFFSDTSVSKIRADLKIRAASNAQSENAGPAIEEVVFAARLFLAVAEEHDVHCFDLLEDMAAQKKMEKALYDRIKGEPGDWDRLFHPLIKSMEEDPGNAMTEQRLRAWSVLLLHDPAPPGVFVTDSPAVMDYLESHGARMEIVFSAENLLIRQDEDTAIRGFRKELSEALDHLAGGSAISKAVHAAAAFPVGSMEQTVSLTVAVAPGLDARRYFGGFAPRAAAGTDAEINARYTSTVICRISPSLL